ncbi:MAG TPA: hypothetical protein VHB50_19695, partial [Bryobacteraceae bacterium]|nr:hypothetical protein [Bryobacteraceae bacterium]
MFRLLVCLCVARMLSALPVDVSGIRPGPVRIQQASDALTLSWPDDRNRNWSIEFSTDGKGPVIRRITANGSSILENIQPVYFADTGVRRGGWDQFFDFPPSHPDGIRRFQQEFKPSAIRVRTSGDRVEVEFEGLRLGIFRGSLVYTIYPGSRLVQQEAV